MLSSLLPWQFSSCRCLCYFFTSTRSTCLSQGHLQHISEPPSKTTNYSVCLADFATSPPSSTATWKKGSGRQPAVALKWSSLTHMFLQRLGNSWMSALRTSTALKWWMWSLPCYNKSLCTEHFQLQAWKPQTIRRLQDFHRRTTAAGKKGCSPAAGSCITPVKQHGICYPHRFATSGVSGRHREQTSEKVHKRKQFNIQIKSFSPSLLVSHLSIKSMAYMALEDG